MDDYFEDDFLDNEILIHKIKDFAERKVVNDFENLSADLLRLLTERVNKPNRALFKPADLKKSAPPILPKRFTSTSPDLFTFLAESPRNFYEIDVLEIARQLALIEFEQYRLVKVRDCLEQIWAENKKGFSTRKNVSPNIMKMIKHTNMISTWVATCLLSEDNLKERSNVLRYFVQVAIVSSIQSKAALGVC